MCFCFRFCVAYFIWKQLATESDISCCTVIFLVATMEIEFTNVRFLGISLDGRVWIIMLLIATTLVEELQLCIVIHEGNRSTNYCDHLWQWLRDIVIFFPLCQIRRDNIKSCVVVRFLCNVFMFLFVQLHDI